MSEHSLVPRYEVRQENILDALVYHDGYAFYFSSPALHDPSSQGVARIGYGDASVQVHLPTGRVGGVEGFIPTDTWRAQPVQLPAARRAAIYVVNVEALPLTPGVTWCLKQRYLSGVSIDPETGWCHIGMQPDETSVVIEVARGVRFVLRIDAIIGAYVRPANIEEVWPSGISSQTRI